MAGKLTASVVGAGGGGRLSMNALTASERFELLAVADIDPQALAAAGKEFPGVRTFPAHAEMFAACPTDVVCVSTWAPSHAPIALEALELPLKGILVEKPLGDTAEAGRRIVRAVKSAGLPLAVPHGLVTRKTPLEVLQRVRGGEIGELKLMEIQCTRWDVINAGIHWLHFFVNLIGDDPIDHVMGICECSTRTHRDGMQVETTAVSYVQTASGIRAVMQTGDDVRIAREGKHTLFRIVGTGGAIEFWPWENGYLLLNAERPSGEVIVPEELPVTGHRRHLEDLADMVDAARCDYAVADTSLRALELCEAAYLSSRHRCKVAFPLEQFRPPPEAHWDPGRPYSGSGGGRDGRKL